MEFKDGIFTATTLDPNGETVVSTASAEDVQKVLIEAAKVKRKPGETAEEFTTRLVLKLNRMVDESKDLWASLGTVAQFWMNENVGPLDDPPQPVLYLLSVGEAEAEPEPEVQEETVEASTHTNGVKRAKPGRPKAAAKKVQPVVQAAKKAKKAAPPKAKAKSIKAKLGRPAKVATKKAVDNRGRAATYGLDQKIKMLVKKNPHREGSGRYKRWPKYRDGMTVGEALKAGFIRQNLYWSIQDGHIQIK